MADVDSSGAGDTAATARYLNELRVQAGLAPLGNNPHLQQAAEHHALYLARHRGNPHRQQPGLSGFRGRMADDRALAAGYRSRAVSENVSRGQRNSMRSIDDLMSALYHRFGFLDGSLTDIGIGRFAGGTSMTRPYVYLMGNHWQEQLCRGEVDPGARFTEGYYDQVCSDGRRVDVVAWAEAALRPEHSNPGVVLWPPADSDSALPAFYDEIPDPLPHLKVSGYPISVQFNPLSFPQAIRLLRFDLWDRASGSKMNPALVMRQGNDPNKKLTAHQFALFPYQRLRWGHDYRVEFEYEYQGARKVLRWQFRTRALSLPVTRVSRTGMTYRIGNGVTRAFVFQPAPGRELYRDVRWSYTQGARVDVDWEDDNTLLITLRGRNCDRADLKFANGLQMSLVAVATGQGSSAADEPCRAGAASGGTRPIPDRPSSPPEKSPRPRAKAEQPSTPQGAMAAQGDGNILQGKGELFTVRAAREYRFTVRPTMVYPVLGNIRLRESPGVSAHIERIDERSFSVTAQGRVGGAVMIDLGDGRYFKVVVVD